MTINYRNIVWFLGITFLLIGSIAKAQPPASIGNLIAQLKHTQNNQQKVGILLQLASLETKQKQYNSAILHANQVLTFTHNNQPLNKTKALLILGFAYQKKQQYTNALTHYLQARTMAEELKKTVLIIRANQSLGNLYYSWKVYDKALKYYQKAYSLTGNQIRQANIAAKMSSIYAHKDNNNKAIDWQKKALGFYKTLNNQPQIATSLLALSALCKKESKYDEALGYNEQIIARKGKVDNALLMKAYDNVGFLYRHNKKYRRALKYYNEALDIGKQINNPKQADILTNIAVIQIRLNNILKAEIAYKKALKHTKKQKDELATAEVYNHLATLNYIYGKTFLASEYAQNAINLAKPYENQAATRGQARTTLTTSYKLFANLYRKEENYQLAQKYYQLYSNLINSQKQEEQRKKQQLLQNQIEIEQKESELNLLLKEKEKQALALKQAKMEAQQKESDLKLRTKELELLRKNQQLQQEKLKSQQLEQARMKQLLAFAKQQAFASEQKQKIALLEKNKAFQALALKQKETEQKEKQQKIALLEKDRKMKAASLKEAKTIRKYGLWVISLGTLAFITVVVGLVGAFRSKKKVVAQNKLINIKQEEILTQNEEMQQQQEELAAQRDFAAQKSKELDHQNQQMKKSIVYASNIQNALLPSHTTLADHFREHFVIFLPKDIVSGDFYWFAQINEHKFLAVVDCTGHGVPGAFMSMIGNTVLNETVNEKRVDDPAYVLARLHDKVREGLNQQVGQNTDGMDVCLCRLTSIDDNRTEVVFAGAKRNLYYIQEDQLHKLKGDRVAIGGHQHEKKRVFTNKTVILNPGNALYLMSDGFVDIANPKRRSFGTKRFEEVLTTHVDDSLATQKQLLLEAMKKFQKDAEQRDDILVIGVRV